MKLTMPRFAWNTVLPSLWGLLAIVLIISFVPIELARRDLQKINEIVPIPLSDTYYTNVPIGDVIKFQVDASILHKLPWASIITSSSNNPVVIETSDKEVVIRPQTGSWDKKTTFQLIVKPPQKGINRLITTFEPRLGETFGFEFTTAGQFGVITTQMTSSLLTPGDDITLRFNDRLKDPAALASFIAIEPSVPFIVTAVEENTEEKGLLYKIGSKEFQYKETYRITIKPGLLSVHDEALAKRVELTYKTIVNPNTPSITFGANNINNIVINYYRENAIQIPVQLSKTNKAEIRAYAITAADAINFLVYKEPADEDDYWQKKPEYHLDTKGYKTAWQSEYQDNKDGIVTIPSLQKGVYLLEARSVDAGTEVITQSILNVSSLAAIAKIGDFDTVFWVSDVMTGRGIGDASVRLYKLNGGAKIIASGTSTENGLVEMKNPGKVDIAVVFKDTEMAIVPILSEGNHLTRSGQPLDAEGNWGYGYPEVPADGDHLSYTTTDRPIYKLGDVVHYKSTIRQDNDSRYTLNSNENYIVTVKKEYWNSQESPLFTQKVSSNEYGSIFGDITLGEEFAPGKYYLSIVRKDKVLSTVGFILAEYRKPTYHLEVSTDKTRILLNDQVKAHIKATYSFGSPVQDQQVAWTLYSNPWYTSSSNTDSYEAKYSYDYGYGWWEDYGSYYGNSVTSGTVTLNANGEGYVDIDISKFPKLSERSQLTIEAEIMDEGSTPEIAAATFQIAPSAYQLEVLDTNHYGNAPSITTRLVDENNQPVANAKIELGQSNAVVQSQTTNESGVIVWDMKQRGTNSDYVFSWDDKQGHKETYKTYFYVYTSQGNIDENPLIVKTETANIAFPDTVLYGESKEFSVSNGGQQHLVTMERGTVLTAMVVDDNSPKSIEIIDDYMPNMFIATYSFREGKLVTGYKAVNPSDLADYKHIDIQLQPEKQNYKPGEEVSLTITTLLNQKPVSSEVSLAVVDKSIFDLKKASTDPIHPYFYRRRFDNTLYAESVSGIWTWDLGGRGGGGGGGVDVRDQFADTAYYKPNIETDTNGQAQIRFTLPDNLTTWNMSAYAVTKDTSVGETSFDVTAQKDIYVLPIFPSYITEGDALTFQAVVGNQTKQSQAMKASFAFNNLLPTNPTQTFTLEANQTRLVKWPFVLSQYFNSGKGEIIATTNIDGLMDGVSVPIPVLKKGMTYTLQESGIDNATVTPKLMDGADSKQSVVKISGAAGILGYVSDILEYQSGYPYGCVEQTMSRFYPTLLVSKYKADITLKKPELLTDLPAMIDAGLKRITKFQHQDGGWGLWETDTSSVYNTSYVLTGLADLASAASVPQSMIDRGLRYLETQYSNRSMDQAEKVAALVPLSRFRNPTAASIAAELADLKDLDDQEVAQTAYALSVMKHSLRTRYIDELVKRATAVNDQQTAWKTGTNNKYHPHQNLTIALAIQALLENNPNQPLITKALNYLNSHRNANVYGSTYTNTQVAKAFIEYSRLSGQADPDYVVQISQSGKLKFEGRISRADQTFGPVELVPNEPVSITKNGAGSLLWNIQTQNSFSGALVARESPRLKITRSYSLSRKGNQSYQVGDVVTVTINIINKGSNPAYNLVVSDPLPAGFEAINNQLDNQSSGNNYWYGNSSQLYADKVVMFPYMIQANSSTQVTYRARAFVPGTFTANPTTAALMYDAEVPAIADSAQITVE